MSRMDRSRVYSAVLDVKFQFPLYTQGNVPVFSIYRDHLVSNKALVMYPSIADARRPLPWLGASVIHVAAMPSSANDSIS
jgi:hypothetical protein